MFDINEIINESFFMSPLQRAQKDGYVNITGPEGKRKIETKTDDFSKLIGTINLFIAEPIKAAVENTAFTAKWTALDNEWRTI